MQWSTYGKFKKMTFRGVSKSSRNVRYTMDSEGAEGEKEMKCK